VLDLSVFIGSIIIAIIIIRYVFILACIRVRFRVRASVIIGAVVRVRIRVGNMIGIISLL
jgi:hypothetical protein